MKRSRCAVCGYVHVGEGLPEKCPNCGAVREKFAPVAEDFEEVHMPYGQKLAYGPDVEVNPFFGDFEVTAPFVYNLPRGQKVKLHKHPHNDELFFILKGRLKFKVGGREFVALPGDLVKGKMNIPHCFENVGDEPAAFLSVKAPKPVSVEFVDEAETLQPEAPAPTPSPAPTAVTQTPAAPVVTPLAEEPVPPPMPPAPRAYGR